MRPPRTAAAGILTLAVLTLAAPLIRAQPTLHVDPSVKQCEVRFSPSLTQASFHRFVREFGSVSSFKQMGPAGALGRGSFLFSLEMITFGLDDASDAWNDTFVHPDAAHWLGSRQNFPQFRLAYGAADTVDLGLYYTKNFSANYGWLGVDAKWNFWPEGNGAGTGLSVRGAYTKTLYVADMSMQAFTLDATVQKSLSPAARPYLGLGADYVTARETSAAVSLSSERVLVPHALAGFSYELSRRLRLDAEITWGALLSEELALGFKF